MHLGGEHKTKLNYSTYQTKFDARMTKMKRNYMANIIMKYEEQFVNFPGKQGLAMKSKQVHWTFWHHQLSTAREEGGGGNFRFLFDRGGGIYSYKLLKLFPSKHQLSVLFFFLISYATQLPEVGWHFFFKFGIWFFFGWQSNPKNYNNHFPQNICREFIRPVAYFLLH